jgi:hypothetical protein
VLSRPASLVLAQRLSSPFGDAQFAGAAVSPFNLMEVPAGPFGRLLKAITAYNFATPDPFGAGIGGLT